MPTKYRGAGEEAEGPHEHEAASLEDEEDGHQQEQHDDEEAARSAASEGHRTSMTKTKADLSGIGE